MSHLQRLQKVMAAAGIASRRKCENLILEGKVKVNGNVVNELGFKVRPAKDVIEVDGKVISFPEKVYLILNKPAGYLTTVSDSFNRPTVMDLIKEEIRVFPVGRLDYDTEGLLIFTNAGELAHRLMHPGFKLKKTYVAEVKGCPDDESLDRLRSGIKLEDGITYPAGVKLIKKGEKSSTVTITISEGRKRQVRRMFEAIGCDVVKLKRTKYGPLTLKGLKLGKYRHLSDLEIKSLMEAVDLKQEVL